MKIGMWIDHEKAVIVAIEEGQENSCRIESGAEGRHRVAGGSRSSTPYGSQDISSERKALERRKHQLHRYYQKIIDRVEAAESIFIFGPGEAKLELAKELRRRKDLARKIAGVGGSDSMTDRQIAARVREFYGESRQRRK